MRKPISKPLAIDAPDYFHYYIGLTASEDLIKELQISSEMTRELLNSLKEGQEHYRYAEGKWSIVEVIRHLVDCERIFAYRILRFSRRDATVLPGFDEDAYILNAAGMQQSKEELAIEFNSQRHSTMALLAPLTDELLDFCGNANGWRMNSRALGYMVNGHNLHHLKVIRERYLS